MLGIPWNKQATATDPMQRRRGKCRRTQIHPRKLTESEEEVDETAYVEGDVGDELAVLPVRLHSDTAAACSSCCFFFSSRVVVVTHHGRQFTGCRDITRHAVASRTPAVGWGTLAL
jgi:hypothetical protein